MAKKKTKAPAPRSEEPAKPKKGKARQSWIPGTEPPSIPEIDLAAEEYIRHRDARMASLKPETEAADRLLRTMLEHGQVEYRFDGYTVSVATLQKVKAKRTKDEDGWDGELD